MPPKTMCPWLQRVKGTTDSVETAGASTGRRSRGQRPSTGPAREASTGAELLVREPRLAEARTPDTRLAGSDDSVGVEGVLDGLVEPTLCMMVEAELVGR